MLLSALRSIEVSPDVSKSARFPEGVKAALLYRDGEWDKAHQVVQDFETPEASFWHAIFHRHEGDWSNAGYWFRKVGQHPVYPAIHADAEMILKRADISWRLGSKWNPLQFIEWCEEAARTPASVQDQLVTDIQVAEWRHLFTWCAG